LPFYSLKIHHLLSFLEKIKGNLHIPQKILENNYANKLSNQFQDSLQYALKSKNDISLQNSIFKKSILDIYFCPFPKKFFHFIYNFINYLKS
jgi:hypothetical protein